MSGNVAELNEISTKDLWKKLIDSSTETPQKIDIAANPFEDKTITDPKERERLFKQDDHFRIFGQDYNKRLEQGGWYVTEDKFVMEMPVNQVIRFALPKDEIIYLCEKK